MSILLNGGQHFRSGPIEPVHGSGGWVHSIKARHASALWNGVSRRFFGKYEPVFLHPLDGSEEAGRKGTSVTPDMFRTKYRFLVWSNPGAPDTFYLRAALLAPHLDILLDALEAFGLDRLREEWNIVKETEEGRKVAGYTETMLENFSSGVRGGAP